MYEAEIKKVIKYIEENYQEPITLDKIAQQFGFSKFHFHRIFQFQVGMTITEYIRMRRLVNASTALLHTNERILDIAINLQFGSQESFTRAFKEVYKLPPGKYRRLMSRIIEKKTSYEKSREF